MLVVEHQRLVELSPTEPKKWCMLVVRPGKEQEAMASFRRHDVRAYWPNYSKFSQWSPELRPTRRRDYRSVIPGYVFTSMPVTPAFWDVIERNVGVINVVRNYSGDLYYLRDRDIEVIRDIERGLNTPQPGKSLHNYKTGDKVRFIDDAHRGFPPGRIGSAGYDGRVWVEVEMMGRIVPWEVHPYQIERA